MTSHHEPIALIGSACRFPGGSDRPSKLWELLQKPRDLVRPIPADRFDAEAYYHADGKHHGTSNVRQSYFLEQDAGAFDHGFFHIQAGEAEAIDPQQRLLLETVYESLCAGGQTIEGLRGSSTSVFVGVMCGDWDGMMARDLETYPQYGATGTARSILSNRVSYFFDWHGPCMTLDTACSSSLVAVHQAIQTLQSGESEVAIAAGANLILSPEMYVAESKLSMLSPRGHSRMWDSSVDGYARGEGIAAVVLKPLHAALRDNDPIECLIRGTGVNHDGKTLGLTMPSGRAQAALIRETYRRAGLDVHKAQDRPQFFQAHGTGTAAGDPQEAEAIAEAFPGLDDTLYVGSVKTVIGHTEGTAGLASLIGTSLALQHASIPANLHFQTLNPKLEPFCRHLKVPTKTMPWPEIGPGQVRRASINSFGFGGTNAHAILEEYVAENKPEESPGTLFTPLTFSAASESSLRSLMSSYVDYMEASGQSLRLHDLAYSLQTRTSTLAYRVAIAAPTRDEAVSQMRAILNNSLDSTIGTRQLSRTAPRILGVFTGQGAQWPRMGARLLETSPFVRQRLSELDDVLAVLPAGDAPSWTLQEMILAGPEKSKMGEAAVSQPLCTAVQIVLVDLLRLADIHFTAVIGHSSGEIGAAYAAGLLSARDAITVAYYRGLYAKLAKSPHGSKGAMMAVGTTFEDAEDLCSLEDFDGRIQVAARNSLTSITLSGDEDAIHEAVAIFQDEGKFARQLRVDTAYHSSHMRPCNEPYRQALARHRFDEVRPTGVQWYSSVYPGQVLTDGRRLSTEYWVDNMASPVLFAPAATLAWSASGPFDLAVEVGPHPALQTPCLDTLETVSKDRLPYTGLLARTKDDVRAFSAGLGFVWTHLGPGSVDFARVEAAVSGDVTTRRFLPDLPLYPFDHGRSFMALSRSSGLHVAAQEPPHPLLGRRCRDRETTTAVQWRNVLTPREIPWLLGHQIEHQIIFPATGYVAMAIEAVHAYARQLSIGLLSVRDFVIHRPLVFAEDDSKAETLVDLRVVQRSSTRIVAQFACYAGSVYDHASALVPHADGTVEVTLATPLPDSLPPLETDDWNLSDLSPDRFYAFLASLGYHYAWPFHGIRQIRRRADYAVGVLEDQSATAWEDRLLVHPGMLDTALQTCFAAFSCPGDERIETLHLPTAIRSLRINPLFTAEGRGKQPELGFAAVTRQKNGHLLVDIQLCTTQQPSQTFLQLEDVEFVSLAPANPGNDVVLFSRLENGVASPDGKKAVAAVKLAPADLALYADVEKMALHYFRQLLSTVSEDDVVHSLPQYRRLYRYIQHRTSSVLSENTDAEGITELADKWKDHESVRLVQWVGENLAAAVQSASTLTPDLDWDFGLEQMNVCLAAMVGQITHRYPHMNILEIDTFSRYTFTDSRIDRLSDDRLVYKPFDLDQDPETQEFDLGTYDLVICSGRLHTSADIRAAVQNIRRLLRPGGYVLILEMVANRLLWTRLRDSLSGASPSLSLPQWDALLAANGFGGLDTSTPPLHDLVPWRVLCAQAVDDRVALLRSPLAPSDLERRPLALVGGTTPAVAPFVDMLTKHLEALFAIRRVRSVSDLAAGLPAGCSVLSVTELDAPLLATPSPATWAGLQQIWSGGRTVLWLTTGAPAAQPHAQMTTGMGRCVRAEQADLMLQFLDVDAVDASTAALVAAQCVRLERLRQWTVERESGELQWSLEPEMYVDQGVLMLPRLYPYGRANGRYNTARRLVTEDVDPGRDSVVMSAGRDALEVQRPSPLRLARPSLCLHSRTIRVTHFLLSSLPVAAGSRLRLVAGKDTASQETVLAFSPTEESLAVVPASWTLPLPSGDVLPSLSALSSFFIAQAILQTAAQNTLLLHECPLSVAFFLKALARADCTLCFTTSQKTDREKDWVYVHEALPKRTIRDRLPSSPATFLDLSDDGATSTAITQCLPPGSQTVDPWTLGWSSVHVASSVSVQEISNVLQHASSTQTSISLPVATLDRVPSGNGRWTTLVDCTGHAVSAVIRPIDDGLLFHADKTYLLVGLTGALGQSLCQWMVEHGARHVVLTSRTPHVPAAFVDRIARKGAAVTVLSMDVTSQESTRQCYDTIVATLPPVAGVINGAMVLRDHLFAKMPHADFMAVTKPKVQGSLLLDALFGDAALDFFIFFSSTASVFGNRGQGNYVAANQFMCSLATQRKQRGLAGSAIDVSPIIGMGYVERDDVVDEHTFLNMGYRTMAETDLHVAVAEAILVGRPSFAGSGELVTGVAPVSLGEHAAESHFADPKLSHFIRERQDLPSTTKSASAQPVRVQLATAKAEDAASILSECFLARLHRILAIAPDEPINEKMTFVEQGVDSLMAVEVRSWFVKELGLDFSVLKILGGSSIADLLAEAVQLLQQPAGDRPKTSPSSDQTSSSASSTDDSATTPVTPLDASLEVLDDVTCRMSFGQEGFWFLDQYLANKTPFNMAVMVKLTGPLRVGALETAVDLLGARHEILRTRFFWAGAGDERKARQGIAATSQLRLRHKTVGSDAEAHGVLEAIRREPWDLSSRPTSKAFLLTLSDDVHFLVLAMHHILADGYTFGVLWRDLETAYRTQRLPVLPVESQYRSFVHQQRLNLELGALDAAIQFHRTALESHEAYLQPMPLLSLAPAQAARQPLTRYVQHVATVPLDAGLAAQLRRFARQNQATTFHVYLCALQRLLFQLLPPRVDDLFLGIADANRLDKQFMASAGFFLNLLPLHFRRGESRAASGVQDARDKVFGALAHSQVPFDVLLRALHIPRSNTHTPLFQVFVDYKQMDLDGADWAGCTLSDETWRNTNTGYDIELDIHEFRGDEAVLALRLQETLYSQEDAEVLMRSYVGVLEHLVDERPGDIPTWSQQDISTALSVGKGVPVNPQWPATIVHRIDDVVAAYGDRTAIKDGHGVTLTYQQMARRIDAIAQAIEASGTSPGALVGVFQEPAADWTCSMLAILRTGRVYVPLDLRNTIPRLAAIIETARPAAILTDTSTTDLVSSIGGLGCVEILVSGIATGTAADTPPTANRARRDAPAVVLFTSGSTGTPKGIVLRHENIVLHAEVESQLYGFASAPGLTVLHQSPYSFDLSIDQPCNALANGGCLVVVPARSRGDPVEVAQMLLDHHVTYASCTPAEFDLWLRFAPDILRRCRDWQYAFSGGEAMSRSLALALQALCLPQLRVFTGYGPSETTIWMAKIEIDYAALPDPIPAGRLLPGYACAVVDEAGCPVPLGVAGEIVIGGSCVSAGYLYNEASTTQKFRPDTLWGTSTPLYHTGDCGRLLADGTVLCEGRLDGDTQVKLRGFRMELAEIERAIVQFADGALSQAVVTKRGAGDQTYLAAHVVFAPAFPREAAVRDRSLRQVRQNLPLPPYMRPSMVVPLDDVPLTAHNKVDRRAVLALPVTMPALEAKSNTAVLGDTERRLADLWRQVLPVDPGDIEPSADFFLVGGNSILLVKLQSLLRSSFAVAPKLVTLMGAPTLAAMAAAVDASQPTYTIDWDVETQLPASIVPDINRKVSRVPKAQTTVLLTGAHGYLGRHLLPALAQDDAVAKIYCLVRHPDAHPGEDSAPKAVVVPSDLSLPRLGLADDVYAALASEVDVIVHCAANRSLWDRYHVLRPDNVQAVRELALLSHATKRVVPLHVLSSGAVATYDTSPTMQPPVDGSEGYLASKWAAEAFLRRFAAATETPVYIHRPEPAERAESSTTKVMDELATIADQLGLRPAADDIGGSFHVTHVSAIVSAIREALHASVEDTTDNALHVLHHAGTVKVPMAHLQARLGRESALGQLPSFPLLDWFGKAKTQGLSQFVTSWELVMGSDNRLISRR